MSNSAQLKSGFFNLCHKHVILPQRYEFILIWQRKCEFFYFFSEEGGREGSGNGFLDRAHALSWAMSPLRGLGSFYCNGVIVMVCVDGITITALQYFMPILKSSHFFVQSSFVHPSFILRLGNGG